MATVYSLVCWGGSTGKAVTFTDAGDVVNLSYHGLRDGAGVEFTDNAGNTLPTGLSKNVTYYAKQGADVSKFTLWTTSALTTPVTFTGTGTGTHYVKGAYYLGLVDKSRWTIGVTEYIYDGLYSWNTAMAARQSPYNSEICEVGEAFDEHVTSYQLVISALNRTTLITSKVNGVRSGAFHNGVVGAGYVYHTWFIYGGSVLNLSAPRTYVDGISLKSDAAANHSGLYGGTNTCFYNCIASGLGSGVSGAGYGLNVSSTATSAINCLLVGWNVGMTCGYAVANALALNCTFTKNGVGVNLGYSALSGYYYNNIFVGNTTNYAGPAPSAGTPQGASNNAGLSTDSVIVKTGGTRINMTDADFADWTNNNFRPALATSPQVSTAVEIYESLPNDISDNTRPAYPGALYGTDVTAGSFVAGLAYRIATVGTTDFIAIGATSSTVGIEFKATGVGAGTGTATLIAKYDVGCYEYDLDYGPWPATHTLTLTNVVVGSRIFISDQAGTTTHYNAEALDSTVVIPVTVYADSRDQWRIRIRNGTNAPKQLPFETLTTAFAGSQSIFVSQITDVIA